VIRKFDETVYHYKRFTSKRFRQRSGILTGLTEMHRCDYTSVIRANLASWRSSSEIVRLRRSCFHDSNWTPSITQQQHDDV